MDSGPSEREPVVHRWNDREKMFPCIFAYIPYKAWISPWRKHLAKSIPTRKRCTMKFSIR
jgi:hypothetical protein